jgi:hypothetical protein
MSTTLRDAPLPCPFCGHVGLDFQEGSTFRWLEYSCGGCGVTNETRVQTLGEGTPAEWREQAERDAIKQWNTRAALAHSDSQPVASGKRFCTCDGAGRGPGRKCVVKDGGRLGENWTCRELAASLQEAQPRTLLEQYDLDQSADYRKGYEDGRLKGFEVGQRMAAQERLNDKQRRALEVVFQHYGNDRRVQCLRPLLVRGEGAV